MKSGVSILAKLCRHLAKPINSQILKFHFFVFFQSLHQCSSCANIEFVLLTDFELSVVAKPVNSISVQIFVKNFKK